MDQAGVLTASLKGGYAQVSNLLLEGLASAPLAASELQVCLHIIRCTYGWTTGEGYGRSHVVLTARQVSEGTGLDYRTVKTAIQRLVAGHVIEQRLLKAGGACEYGMQPDLTAWGDGKRWAGFAARLQDARLSGAFRAPSVAVDGRRTPTAKTVGGQEKLPPTAKTAGGQEKLPSPGSKNCPPPAAKTVGVPPGSPTGTGGSGVPKDVDVRERQNDVPHSLPSEGGEGVNDPTPPPAGAPLPCREGRGNGHDDGHGGTATALGGAVEIEEAGDADTRKVAAARGEVERHVLPLVEGLLGKTHPWQAGGEARERWAAGLSVDVASGNVTLRELGLWLRGGGEFGVSALSAGGPEAWLARCYAKRGVSARGQPGRVTGGAIPPSEGRGQDSH